MQKIYFLFILLSFHNTWSQTPYYDSTREGFLVFHPIKTDKQGSIVPWYNEEPGIAYDFVINATWHFWDTMRRDMNGLPYYMNHQVWRPENDPRGLGGDQLAMALSSWQLLYEYSGNERVKENMKFIADYYLTHSLSPANARWPNIPFPYNTMIYSGFYDGDMVIGKGYTQPDKAGSFAYELVKLYKISGNENYLQHAILIANTLARFTKEGNDLESPLPFKVNAFTGEAGVLKSNSRSGKIEGRSVYTTNFVGTIQLWMELMKMKQGDAATYQGALEKMISWMKKYPMQNNKWGPFFEDISGWSDTQINAVTFARFILENKNLFPDWKTNTRNILDWVYEKLGNNQWQKYGGLKVVNEQTAYMTPGNSHTSRQAAAELLYALNTGDNTNKALAVQQLNWATYMVAIDGKNNYPRDEVWLTDGYGDYIRHYLNAMDAAPELAPSNQNHILYSTSIVTQADYYPNLNKRLEFDVKKEDTGSTLIFYRTFDQSSTEKIRLTAKPSKITLNKKVINEVADVATEGWKWEPLKKGGVLYITHQTGNTITIFR
ncbi:hypothetical protein [Segetibacter aerophilus]|uniref:Alpha-L-rhamnosidase six-hairpin glycosidase domain-containing protein n=1 Tax=Segetibacter aerophilus TaxID=670293 RepID=A0A512BIU6_9BACT|nr:hypothetical protein [Segetibacter aerophilus]GEO11888.1 hypothetical protein SAE01_43840 [Segetibacter aerophilus]